MPISLVLMRRISCLPYPTRSWPCQRISPPTICPGGIAISLSTESAVTVLPHPYSPTTPRVSPLSMVRSTPSTARTMPSSVAKCVFRPRISSRCSTLHHFAGIERVAQSITDEVDRQHCEKDRAPGDQGPMRGDVQVILSVEQDAPPGRNIRREAEAKKRQGRFEEDRDRDVNCPGDDDGSQRIRQDVAHHLAPFCRAPGACRLDKFLFAQRQKLRAHQSRDRHPAECPDHRDDQDKDAEFGPNDLLQRVAKQIDDEQQHR